MLYDLFFLFKPKTAYEMRISDWSSDVCSSDLLADHRIGLVRNAIGGGQVIGLVEIDVVHFGAGDEGLDLQRLVAFGYGCGDFLRLQHDIVAVARLIAFHLVVAFDGLACLLIDILPRHPMRSEAHTSDIQSLMRHSYAVFCLKKKKKH